MGRKASGAIIGTIFALMPGLILAHTVQGPGALSCAEYGKIYQAHPQAVEDVFFAWAQGFMSSLNVTVMTAKGRPRELGGDTDAQRRSLRSYCANHPLKNYTDGVIEFYGSLPFVPRLADE